MPEQKGKGGNAVDDGENQWPGSVLRLGRRGKSAASKVSPRRHCPIVRSGNNRSQKADRARHKVRRKTEDVIFLPGIGEIQIFSSKNIGEFNLWNSLAVSRALRVN